MKQFHHDDEDRQIADDISSRWIDKRKTNEAVY